VPRSQFVTPGGLFRFLISGTSSSTPAALQSFRHIYLHFRLFPTRHLHPVLFRRLCRGLEFSALFTSGRNPAPSPALLAWIGVQRCQRMPLRSLGSSSHALSSWRTVNYPFAMISWADMQIQCGQNYFGFFVGRIFSDVMTVGKFVNKG